MRVTALAIVLAVLAPELAFAHSDGLPIGPAEVWHHWSFDPWVWAPLLLCHWLYGRGVFRLWKRAGIGRAIPRWRVGCFLTGEIVLVVALLSPLDPLGETLLSAHMTQHLLLTSVAPALLLLGIPATAWLWSIPQSWRHRMRARLFRWLHLTWLFLTRPLLATFIHGVVIWGWHVPAAFNAALGDNGVHTFEHLSFLLTGLMFWQAVSARTASPFFAAILILISFVHMGALAALLVIAPVQIYAYGDRALLWSLSPVEDQQLAGLLMWVPAGLIYLAAFAGAASRLFPREKASPRPSTGIMRASTSSPSMK